MKEARTRGSFIGVVVCVLLALLLASAAASALAQSGRRSTTPLQGKETPTPTPAAVAPHKGPIAEPPRPARDEPKPSPRLRTDDKIEPPAPDDFKRPASKQKTGGDDDDGEVVRISSNLVPVPASVLDAQGRVVTDLRVEDFELLVDGRVRPVGDFSHAETPVTIALLFDNSSSLNATRDFERKAGIEFLKSVVRKVDRAAVYSISTTPELAQPLTNDVRALVRTVEGFGRAEGATALFDTIAAAADYLQPEKTRKVIVIVSDGTDTISDLDFDQTLARVLADDCQVYAVQTGNSPSANLRDLAGERRLQEFAAQTGGEVFIPHSNAELNAAFNQIAADLSQQYVLSYYPDSAEPRDGRFRSFTLNIKTRPNLRVRTRKGYYAPKG
ncbi:MAG TPA: VWA domain-containing protein [Pyrinomonadaceae bacterium]|nr:VWA domain-containing protein [Pyrinomonadaceae bacterium]